MTEILSQDEIDVLLTAISTGESEPAAATAPQPEKKVKEPPKVKVWDFKKPIKFSKDHTNTLTMIHENFARFLNTMFAGLLRSGVYIHVANVEQLQYEEFVKTIPSPTMIAIIEMNPLKGTALIEIDPSITFSIIDRLFGGTGSIGSVPGGRELSEVEQAVIQNNILDRLLNNLKEAWTPIIDLKPKLSKIETNPQFVQIVEPNHMVTLITLEAKIGEVEGMINLCIPYMTIEPIITNLSMQSWYTSKRKGYSSESLALLKKKINTIYVPLTAELGSARIPIKELLNLQIGDVVKLEKEIKEKIVLKVGNRKKFLCNMGTVGSKMAVKINSVIRDEE